MGSVNVGLVKEVLSRFDVDGNKKFDKSEVALAARVALQKNNSQEVQDVGKVLGTLAVGGKGNKGLFPDKNRDGFINNDELGLLAAQSGKADRFEMGDFKKAFPKRAVPGGSTIDTELLQSKALKNSEKLRGNPNASETKAAKEWMVENKDDNAILEDLNSEPSKGALLDKIKGLFSKLMDTIR